MLFDPEPVFSVMTESCQDPFQTLFSSGTVLVQNNVCRPHQHGVSRYRQFANLPVPNQYGPIAAVCGAISVIDQTEWTAALSA